LLLHKEWNLAELDTYFSASTMEQNHYDFFPITVLHFILDGPKRSKKPHLNRFLNVNRI